MLCYATTFRPAGAEYRSRSAVSGTSRRERLWPIRTAAGFRQMLYSLDSRETSTRSAWVIVARVNVGANSSMKS